MTEGRLRTVQLQGTNTLILTPAPSIFYDYSPFNSTIQGVSVFLRHRSFPAIIIIVFF